MIVEIGIMDPGNVGRSTVSVSTIGPMEIGIMDLGNMGRGKVTVNTTVPMEHFTTAGLTTMSFTGTVLKHGRMEGSMRALGRMIKCMETVYGPRLLVRQEEDIGSKARRFRVRLIVA
jgi:hypothetical protein